jgi:hypothetical protein
MQLSPGLTVRRRTRVVRRNFGEADDDARQQEMFSA